MPFGCRREMQLGVNWNLVVSLHGASECSPGHSRFITSLGYPKRSLLYPGHALCIEARIREEVTASMSIILYTKVRAQTGSQSEEKEKQTCSPVRCILILQAVQEKWACTLAGSQKQTESSQSIMHQTQTQRLFAITINQEGAIHLFPQSIVSLFLQPAYLNSPG